MSVTRHFPIAVGILLASLASASFAQETASFAVDTDVKLTSDLRNRGVSDSLNQPSIKLSVQAAHESGLVGLVEIVTVSQKQFTGGSGIGITVAGGYRFGDPEAWHFGVGLAAELFPGASYQAPHGFDLETGSPTDLKTTNFDTNFAVLEFGYGAVEARLLNVISNTYRGIDTGGVCGTMLQQMADPTQGLECFARGDKGSRGSWLLDVDYKFNLTPATTLNLHAGYQQVANFREADITDVRLGLTHKRWGYEWSADWTSAQTKVRELYLVQDGNDMRATDDSRFVVSVSRRF